MSASSLEHLFDVLVALHIATGAPGLIAFWGPIAFRKGGPRHRATGRFFTFAMLATGAFASLMATLTLIAPMETHPHLVGSPPFDDPVLVRAIFGWMMLYLAILTVTLAWYGWTCVRDRGRREATRGAVNLTLQAVLFVAALNCAARGALVGQPMMIGISMVGFATVATNLYYFFKPRAGALEWLLEHIKGLVGAGISVYTAFFAFGAVRLAPQLALAPGFWAIPLVVGLALIIHHRRRVEGKRWRPAAAAR